MNRQPSVPKYRLIAAEIERRIQDGTLKSGEMLSSEMKTQQEYNVSRVTVRKAYQILMEKGISRTVHGVGTFVNDLYSKDWTWMSSFSGEVLKAGHQPTTRVIKFQIIEADAALAQKVWIREKEECLFFERLRCIDNQPVWITRSYIPVKVAPGLNADYLSVAGIAQSIFRILELNFNVKCVKGTDIQEAVNVGDKEAQLLNIDCNKPVISKAFLAYDKSDRPIVYENTIMAQSISKTVSL